jgi:hypothetical protein
MNVMRALLVALCLGNIAFAGVGDVVVVRSLRYSVEQGTGRLTVGTEGVPAVVARHSGDMATLGFSHATVSSPPGAARVSFADGPVRSAAIERSGPDSITVFVRLRQSGSLDVGLEGHDVVLRILPPARIQGAGHASTKKTAPATSSPVKVGIATLINAGESPVPAVRRVPEEASGSSVSLGTVLAVLGILLCSALLSLGVAVIVVRMMQRPASSAVPHVPQEEPDTVIDAPVEPSWEQSAAQAEPAADFDDQGEESDDEERGYQLAKALRRGKGEMDLVRRMEGKQDALFGTRVNESCHTAKTQAQRVQNAKRLGIGRGEIDLARRLKDLVPATNSDEEES